MKILLPLIALAGMFTSHAAIVEYPDDVGPLKGSWMGEPKGSVRGIKFFLEGSMSVSRVDLKDGFIVSTFVGKMRCTGDRMREDPKFTSTDWKWMVERPESYPVKFEGETEFTQTFPDREEIYQRSFPAVDPAEAASEASPLDGVWTREIEKGTVAIRFCHQGRTLLVHLSPGSKRVAGQSIGIFKLADGKIQERVMYVTENWRSKKEKQTATGYQLTDPNTLVLTTDKGRTESWTRVKAVK